MLVFLMFPCDSIQIFDGSITSHKGSYALGLTEPCRVVCHFGFLITDAVRSSYMTQGFLPGPFTLKES